MPPPKSILLILLLFIYFNPPPPEIRLIPPEEGLAHRFCVSGSASRGVREEREWGGGGGLRLAQGHVSNVELGRRFVVSSTLPNLLRR